MRAAVEKQLNLIALGKVRLMIASQVLEANYIHLMLEIFQVF